jgi:uncharacterized repeat protein (TIGR03803 family)
MDSSGNLYGTTYGCGANNVGMVWQLSPGGTETILYQFDGVNTGETYAGVVRSRARTNPVGSLRAAARTVSSSMLMNSRLPQDFPLVRSQQEPRDDAPFSSAFYLTSPSGAKNCLSPHLCILVK